MSEIVKSEYNALDETGHYKTYHFKTSSDLVEGLDVMKGATSTINGVSGLVPAPAKGDNEKFLCGDGSFKKINVTNATGTLPIVNGGTGATTAERALMNLGALGLSGGTMTGKLYSSTGELLGDISGYGSTVDFNNLTTNGRFYLGYQAHQNSPTGISTNGLLLVDGQTEANGNLMQTFYEAKAAGNNQPLVYYRKRIGGTWSDWFTQRYVVERYSGETSWYVKYSDGWVEQGGEYNTPTANEVVPVTFPVAMKDAKYTPILTKTNFGGGNGLTHMSVTATDRTTTGFACNMNYTYREGSCCFVWEVKGWGA